MVNFCQTKRIFVGRSAAKVKKICEVWRKMGLFGPDSVPPNQLLVFNEFLDPILTMFRFFLPKVKFFSDNIREKV